MAVAIVVHGSKFAFLVVVSFCEGKFIYLGPVLKGSGLDVECTWIEVLIDASAVVPVIGYFTVDIE